VRIVPDLAALRTQLSEIVGRLTLIQRLAALGLVVAMLAAVIYFTAVAGAPAYQTAFAGLAPADAAVVVEKLKAAQIPYKLAGDGATIQVPAEKVADVRLMLAAEGLPQGSGVGFEIFDKTNLGLTDFAQRINYKRALEGELSRTISRLDSVESARVHIVIPEPSLYTQEKKEPTASVVLKLKPGRKPTPSQIKGVSHLVSGSVEGLRPENLTIVDSNGIILNELTGPGADGLQASASQLELQRSVEQALEKSILAMLDKVLGPNKAAVKVSATLDFDKVEQNAETYSPNGTAPQVRSERKVTDTQSSQGATPGGVPGTDANVPGYQAAQGNTQSSRQLSDTTTNYELSKTVARTVRAPGSIKKLAVAVVLDQQAPVAASQVETIQQLVATAAAIDTKRGDLVTVSALPFDRTLAETEQAALSEAEQREQLQSYLRLGALALAPLLVLIALLVAVRLARRPHPTALVPAFAGGPVEETGRTVVTEVTDPEKLLKEAQAANPHQEQVEFMARKDPAMIAQLMRTWLQDEGHGK
jgi:flagellar M-ring protein FliF